jgi:HK97 family phage major capsid protein
MDFIKKLKALIAKGWATAEEKQAILKELEGQSDEVKEVVADEVEKVEALSEEDPSDEKVEEEVEKAIKMVFKGEKKGITESVKKEVIEEVQKILDAHKSKQKREVGVYSKEAQKDAKRKVMNKFLREGVMSLISGGETEGLSEVKKEMTSGSSATPYAGYITDEYLSAEIRHLQTEYGVASREFTTVSFMQSSYKANNLATDVSVFWVDEADSITSTQAVLGQETLELKKLATIVTLTRELMQEQEIDFISFLGERVAEGFAKAEDQAFFIGDGTSTYGSFTGLLENANVNEVTMDAGDGYFTDITAEGFIDMIDATPQGALANAKFYMHRSILNLVRKLREDAVSAGDGKGPFIYQMPSQGREGNIWGYPVVEVEAMPSKTDSAVDTSFLLFGDLRRATIRGIRGEIIADKFNAGTVGDVATTGTINLITTDREAVRWITQVGYIAIVPSAVTKLTTSSTSA